MRKKLDLQCATRVAWRLATQSVYAVGSNWQWANFKNFFMKISSNFSEICIFRNMLKKASEYSQ